MITKHIPNCLTLVNLLCGCMGIIEVVQNNAIEGAAVFIFIALIADFLDGFAARLLGVSSAIGKELDSLADCVTFGVLPAFIWCHILKEFSGVTGFKVYFGLIVALFSALRLAKFNIDTRQSDSFIGVPTPANAMFVLAVALNLINFSKDFFTQLFTNQWFTIGTILVSSYLMVAEIPLFAFKFKQYAWKGNQMRYGFIIFAILVLGLFQLMALPWIIMAYVILSIFLKWARIKV